ncbi:MAG: ammonia-forming cytochrome c nitrite reductase subunit c552 [Propionibacteriaceae bacterium]|nr:ammonia-forming cytochrome c nitrite reductase subunit c552 [Propionibacteriaceae bacterium]
MTDQTNVKTRKGVPIWGLVLIVIAAAGITFLITALVANIGEKKGEGTTPFTQVVQLTADNWYDPATWGQNYPNEYDGWLATANFTPTAHDAALVPVTQDMKDHVGAVIPISDPRTSTTPSKLTEDPRLKTLWNGYAFALDYRHLRGHQWMLTDQHYTLRILDKPQPGACLNCHASLVGVYDQLGNGDAMAGFAAMNKMTYADAEALVNTDVAGGGSIGCIDCHDPSTMNLRISRPAFINGIAALKASQGIANYDVNKDATTQEMRSYVCAQCHVTYYFAGDDKTLTFPWAEGVDIDNIYDYYQNGPSGPITDYTNALTGMKGIKARHPEFEAWSMGVHAANGVTCADCHMSYQRVGAQKISNHDITTPMADINGTCGTCHLASDQVLQDRVTTIQNRFIESRDRTLDAVTQLITAINAAQNDGTTPQSQIDLAMTYHRQASFYIDFCYSENSYGFHAPDYFQRVLNEALDQARMGQLALLGVPQSAWTPSDVAQANLQGINESGLK